MSAITPCLACLVTMVDAVALMARKKWRRRFWPATLAGFIGLGLKASALQFAVGEPAHIVVSPKTALEQRTTTRLADYLTKVLRQPARVVSSLAAVPAQAPAIILLTGNEAGAIGIQVPTGSPESYVLETRRHEGRAVVIGAGSTERGLKRAVQRLIIQGRQHENGWEIPELKQAESPWIPRREWTLSPWVPEQVRGVFFNPNADKRLNVWLYSEGQIGDYVEMFDAFGFSGCQLIETVANYAALGSADAFQDKAKTFAEAVRRNGQDFTLWVWAAQFDNYGWVDPDVTYTPAAGKTAFDDPRVRAGFEKYYNRYARLAPHVDLLIAHFYDPGSLKNRADVFPYMRLLFDKFKARNPQVQFGVDFWAAENEANYLQQLVDHGFGDVLLLENTMPVWYAPYTARKREVLHDEAKKHRLKLGVWGWYTTEMETDQLPLMHVNAKMLSHFYRQIRDGVHRIHPITYWSEMEAYHLNNIFTMYAASQLLWNPDRDSDEILREISDGIWGPRHGPQILRALQLIEDTRSGPNWDTYWWTSPKKRYGTENPREDLRRAEAAIADLEALTTDAAFVPKFPLPFPPATFVELTLPHLRQIRHFAEFRMKVEEIRALARQGATQEELHRRATVAWQPVPEYNTWIGVFGQPEATEQEKMMMQLARDLDLKIEPPGGMRFKEAGRLLQAIQSRQRFSRIPWQFKAEKGWLVSANAFFPWSVEKFRDRIAFLLDQGCIRETKDQTYQLSDWEEYRQR